VIEKPLPMIQRLIRIGGSCNRLHEDRQNGRQLVAFMRLTGHRLQIAVGLLDVRHSICGEDAADLPWITFGCQQERCGIRRSGGCPGGPWIRF
jgi:hypothetical protein